MGETIIDLDQLMIDSHPFEQFCYGFIMNVQEVFVIVVLNLGQKLSAQFHFDDRPVIETVHRARGKQPDSSRHYPRHGILPLDMSREWQHSVDWCVRLTKNKSS